MWNNNFKTVVSLLCLSSVILGHMNGSSVITVVSKEGSDAMLPCSPTTNENIVQKVFDWKKDDQKEVFLYDAGVHYNNGRTGQDQQFRGRVSHFPEQLKFGNASIIIRNTAVTDSGTYTCIFPHLKPQTQRFNIKLLIEGTFRNRVNLILGAAPEPCVTVLNATETSVLLKCDVRGAFPQPKVEWQDSDRNVLPAEEPQVSYRDNHYSVTLITTVTKTTTTSRFYCVVSQEDIAHRTAADIYVPFYENKSCQSASSFMGGWFSGVLTVAAPLAVFLLRKHIKKRHKKGSSQKSQKRNDQCNSTAEPLNTTNEDVV